MSYAPRRLNERLVLSCKSQDEAEEYASQLAQTLVSLGKACDLGVRVARMSGRSWSWSVVVGRHDNEPISEGYLLS